MRQFIFVLILLANVYFIEAYEPTAERVVNVEIIDNEIRATFTIPPGMHQTYQEDMLYIEADPVDGLTFESVIYPESKTEHDMINFYGSILLRLPFHLAETISDGEKEIKIYAGYQFCDDAGVCFFPEEESISLTMNIQGGKLIQSASSQAFLEKANTKKEDLTFAEIQTELSDFTLSNTAAGYLKSSDFVVFAENAKNAGGSSANRFAGMNIWLILLFIVLGGIALNLTPCVLPIMPITVAVLGAGTQAESKGKGFLIGGLYGTGMMLAYGTLGLIVVLTGSQFGSINSSPWFNLIIAVVFIILALAMFDIIPIDFTRFQSSRIPGKNTGKSKYITIFVLGVIAAVLAGACVAPVLISVILYSVTLYTSGNPTGLLLPFLLGLGMALPWPFVGAGLSILPKPGNWMKWIKIIFGIIIIIIALYYGYTSYHIFASRSQVIDHSVELTENEHKLPWNSSILSGLEQAKKENKPVLIDFWATWCKNCLAMDATTFRDASVQAVLQDYVLIKYQAENMSASPHKEILDYFGIIGLPTYVVILPKTAD